MQKKFDIKISGERLNRYDHPKVTFIVPIYNVEKYLCECLDSIVNQTLQEIQIICVNDGSTDNSLAIVQEYAARDPRILVIDKPNGGLASARNAAFPFIKGEYIQFVDSDDFIDKTATQKLYAIAKQTNADILSFDWIKVDEDSRIIYEQNNQPKAISIIDSEEQIRNYIRHGFSVVVWNKLFRSDLILNVKLMFPEVYYDEDNAFTFLAMALVNKIVFFHHRLYFYRIRLTSIVHTVNKPARLRDMIIDIVFMREELIRLGKYESFEDEYLLYKLKYIYIIFQNSSHVSAKERISTFNKYILPEDKLFFESNQTPFRRSMRGILSAIINNKPLSLADRIYICWRQLLQPFEHAFKTFFRKTFRRNKTDKNIDALLNTICELSEEINELRESKAGISEVYKAA
jgi:glycosyltransferase involved in cell wall biosynthesis